MVLKVYAIINPSEEVVAEYKAKKERFQSRTRRIKETNRS